MGSNTNSPGLLSPRRRLRGYVSLEHTTEDSSENQNNCHSLNFRKETDETSRYTENMHSGLFSPKASPVLRRMQMSRLRRMLSPKSTKKLENIILSDKTEKQWLECHASTSSLESLDPVEHGCTARVSHYQSASNDYSTARRSRHTSERTDVCPNTPKARSSFSSERKTLLHVLLTKTFGRSYKTNSEQPSPGLSRRKNVQPIQEDHNGYHLKWKHIPTIPAKSAPCSPIFDIRTSPVKQLKPQTTYLSKTENRKLYSNCLSRIPNKNHPTGAQHYNFEEYDPLPNINDSKNGSAHEVCSSDRSPESIPNSVNVTERRTSISQRQSCQKRETSPQTCSPKSRHETPPPSYFDLSHPNAPQNVASNLSPLAHRHTNFSGTPSNVSNQSVHCNSCWSHQSEFWYLNQSSATILRNDLGTGRTTVPSIVGSTLCSPTQRQVVLHRDLSCNRFGMKLARTNHPEQITYIAMILPRSPACDAGLQVGDRILTVNETFVDNLSLDSAINLIRTADRILKLTYEPRPFTSYLLTMLVRKQDGKVGIRLKSQQELQIEVVLPHSPAARVGLRAGQRVIGLNGHNVVNWDHSAAMKWLRAYPDEKDLLITVSEQPAQLDRYEKAVSGDQLNDELSCPSEVELDRGFKDSYSPDVPQPFCPDCSPGYSDTRRIQEDEQDLSTGKNHMETQNRFATSDFNQYTLSTGGENNPSMQPRGESNRPSREILSMQSKHCTLNACKYKDSPCVPWTALKPGNLQVPLSTPIVDPFYCPCTTATLKCFKPSAFEDSLNRTEFRTTEACSTISELLPVDRVCTLCKGQREYV